MNADPPYGSIRKALLAGVLLVALASIALMLAPTLLGGSGCGPTSKTKADMHEILQAIELYKLEHKRAPSSWKDLVGQSPTKSGAAARPFLDEIPLDPWGRPYICSSKGSTLEIVTLGADGLPGGEGDDRDQRSSELFSNR